MQWRYRYSHIPKSATEIVELLAQDRGIDLKDQRTPFDLDPVDYFIKEELEKALALITSHIETQQPVLIFGDYDADGVCATSILWQVLYSTGLKVVPFIPDRMRHGYGVSQKALADIFNTELPADIDSNSSLATMLSSVRKHGQPTLIITVDNGIVAHQPLEWLGQHQVATIVTDHHTLEKDATGQVIRPPSDAVIHATKLCGSTVAWLFGRYVAEQLGSSKAQKVVQNSLDLCGIATIADQVPLTGANRIFAKAGLLALQQTQRPGLLALYKSASIKASEIDTYHVNYQIAPRINAVGRLAHAFEAVRLMCTPKNTTATEIAQHLNEINSQRQQLTQTLTEQSSQNIDDTQKIVIAVSEDFHEGVIGLIAGKLAEKFQRPALALAVGDTMIKGSARSIPGINIVELLRSARQYLVEVGGHPMAAGCSLLIENLDDFKAFLYQKAEEFDINNHTDQIIELDIPLSTDLMTVKTVEVLETLSPFGAGNLPPVFGFHGWTLQDIKTMGKTHRHVKLIMENDNNQTLNVIGWNKIELLDSLKIKVCQPVVFCGHIESNVWNGNKMIQINLLGIDIH